MTLYQKNGRYYISSHRFTVLVEVEDGKVKGGPPLTYRFFGQDVERLHEWIQKKGGGQLHVEHLPDYTPTQPPSTP
jgi:hypothetical protein